MNKLPSSVGFVSDACAFACIYACFVASSAADTTVAITVSLATSLVVFAPMRRLLGPLVGDAVTCFASTVVSLLTVHTFAYVSVFRQPTLVFCSAATSLAALLLTWRRVAGSEPSTTQE